MSPSAPRPTGLVLALACVSAMAPLSAQAPLERAGLEAWLDGYFGASLRASHAAGAVIVVVKDGSILLQKGYGYADVEAGKPVDPERTGFRPGSVSKLVTATAVMQLVEQGKLDLDRDVNDYLDFRVPPAFGRPITLRHALTHTPGFGAIVKGIGTDDTSRVETLEVHVKTHVPPRIYPPGTTPAYSNYGLVLAGYIVQRVSGEAFEDYVERHIFAPLGMTRSTFRQPLPASFEADMSKGYITADGDPQPFEILGTMPAGGMTATAGDMARFMIAHLQQGRIDSVAILRPETVRVMHQRTTLDSFPLNGMALGFRESSRNGHRVIGHGGDTYAFHADLELYPDDAVGLFVAFNSLGSGGADANGIINGLVQSFTDRYFPPLPPTTKIATTTGPEHARMAEGSYLGSRHSERSFLSVFNLIEDHVTARPDGTIMISSDPRPDGRPRIWRETGPFLWEEVDGQGRLAMETLGGRVVAIRRSADPATVLLRVPASRPAGWIRSLAIAAILVALITTLAWPASWLVRRRYDRARLADDPDVRADRPIRIASLLATGFVLGWLLLMRWLMSGDAVYMGELDPWIRVLHVLGLALIVATAVAIWAAARALRGQRPWRVKLTRVLQTAACVAVVWFAVGFRLISTGLEY